MTDYLDDDRLRAFGRPARVTVWPTRDALLCIGDAETLLRIVERDGLFVAEKQDRGGGWYPQMNSPWLAVTRRYVLWEIGGWVRSAAGQGLARPVEEPLRDGFTLTEVGHLDHLLQWREPAGERSARLLGSYSRQMAIRFAPYADLSEETIVQRCSTSAGAGLTPQQRRLIAHGMELYRRIEPDADLAGHPLPEDDGVLVVHPIRGGGSIYVAADESVLFAGSALSPHLALAEFRAGRRTPLEKFGPRPPADRKAGEAEADR